MSEHHRETAPAEPGPSTGGTEQGPTGLSAPPVTGDPGVDRILTDLDRQLRRTRADDHAADRVEGPADGQRDDAASAESDPENDTGSDTESDTETDPVTALTEAHRRLQARLSDPGPTPPARG